MVRSRQLELPFPFGWGGERKRAGRKKGRRVSHAGRPTIKECHPIHVTVRVRDGLPSLRGEAVAKALEGVFARKCESEGFRITQWSIQHHHFHLLIEATDRERLARGMQGLSVSLARCINRHFRRQGRVFADRYHAEVKRTPREVQIVLLYVLQNARKHGSQHEGIDLRSSGRWFDGWSDAPPPPVDPNAPRPIAAPRSWLLRVGWRRHGRLSIHASPRRNRRVTSTRGR